MGRRRLTLEDLVAERRFDESNFRHRRALDESGPLADPELEEQRQSVAWHRRPGHRRAPRQAAKELERFARMVDERKLA
jgi:hypothetical protein